MGLKNFMISALCPQPTATFARLDSSVMATMAVASTLETELRLAMGWRALAQTEPLLSFKEGPGTDIGGFSFVVQEQESRNIVAWLVFDYAPASGLDTMPWVLTAKIRDHRIGNAARAKIVDLVGRFGIREVKVSFPDLAALH